MPVGPDAQDIKRAGGHDDFCVVFMHIPKTAGTTLASSLEWNFPPHLTIHVDLHGRAEDLEKKYPLEKRKSVRLLHGHIPYGVHRYIPRPCKYITVMRDPVARAISAYKFIRTRERHELHDRVMRDRIGLEEFIETYWMDKRMNRQTRQLSSHYSGPIDRSALAEAKRNLSGFLIVGLTERFEETFALARRELRLRWPIYATRNVSPSVQVSDRAVELIRASDEYDLELYGLAREIFASQMASQSSSFRLEAAIFRAMRPVFRLAGSGGIEKYARWLSHARHTWHRVPREEDPFN